MPPGSLPPGMRPPGQRPPPPPDPHPAKAHPEHCPGHGPMDPPGHINLWHGLIGVNNDKAGPNASAIDRLLWRYDNHDDPCDPKNEPPPLLASLINFGLLAFLLVRFGRKPIAEALLKRKEAIMGEIETATRLKADAQARLRDYKKKSARIHETLDELKAEYVQQSEVEKARILAEAEERRVRMRRDAEFRIEQERKAARNELMERAVIEAVAAAEALLAQRVGPEDQARAAEEYLTGLGVAVRGSGPGARASAPAGGAR
jgi:F-type H+-transporting ATPase subunit b